MKKRIQREVDFVSEKSPDGVVQIRVFIKPGTKTNDTWGDAADQFQNEDIRVIDDVRVWDHWLIQTSGDDNPKWVKSTSFNRNKVKPYYPLTCFYDVFQGQTPISIVQGRNCPLVLDGDNPKSVIIYNDKWQLGPIKKKIDKFKKGKHNMTGHEEEEILLVFGLKSDNKSEYKSLGK